MDNEIELKVMLTPNNVSKLKTWLQHQTCLLAETEQLGNTYYDTPDHYFAQHKMGLRVRNKNDQYELTLKTKGKIVGGLHIRPEYNVPLPDAEPDFKRLVLAYNLQMPEMSEFLPIFSTDFTREKYVIAFQRAEIEVAFDQGLIKNRFGEEPICEMELELKKGNVSELLQFLDAMPKYDGMWLSGLSKAQRGYLVGNHTEIAKNIEKLTACNTQDLSPIAYYTYEQQVADFLRIVPTHSVLIKYLPHYDKETDVVYYLTSKEYLKKNILRLQKYYATNSL